MDNHAQMREGSIGSFKYFARLMQGPDYFSPAHADLCDFLQSDLHRSLQRYMVVMPRGSYKTTFVKWYVIWRTIRNPDTRTALVSNSKPNAMLNVREICGVFESNDLFRSLFPELLPTPSCKWSNEAAEVNRSTAWKEPTFSALGTGSAVVGRHFDIIVEDDTCAPELSDMKGDIMAPDADDIAQAVGWHKLAFPLQISPKEGTRLVVGTIWSHDDLINTVLKDEPRYKVFDRPGVDEEGRYTFDHLDEEALEEAKHALGMYMFSALYLNKAMRSKDMVFPPEHLRTLEDVGLDDLPSGCEWIISVDPAGAKDMTIKPCDSAMIRVGHKGPMFYIDRYVADRSKPKQVAQRVLDWVLEDYENTKWVSIEKNSMGESLIYILEDLMREEGIYFNVVPIIATRLKQDRILGLQPYFERGQILMRAEHKRLRDELMQFPQGTKRDVIDALAQQLKFYRGVAIQRDEVDKKPFNPRTVENLLKEMRHRRQRGNSFNRARGKYPGCGAGRWNLMVGGRN